MNFEISKDVLNRSEGGLWKKEGLQKNQVVKMNSRGLNRVRKERFRKLKGKIIRKFLLPRQGEKVKGKTKE